MADSRRATKATKAAQRGTASNLHPLVPVRRFPRCARRALAVSAAIGRFDRTPHRTGAAEPATAAAADALDGAAPAEPRTGQKRKASSSPAHSPDVRLKLLARRGYCAPHACADAQGCDSGSECTALHCAALRCSALEGTVLRCTAPALHLHCTVPGTGSCRRCPRPLPRVRTLRCGAGWSCGSDGDRRVLRDDDAAFVGPAS